MLTKQECLILLNLIPDVASLRLRRILDLFGDAERLCKATAEELRRSGGISYSLACRIASVCRSRHILEEELSRAKRQGIEIITLEDPGYPALLKEIHDPPLALYVKGHLPSEDEVAIAVVGSRSASRYGLQTAEHLSYDMALLRFAVISGLARGIDAAAHRGALKAAGRTIAVLGSGLCNLYPPEHKELARQIAQEGAVISEYPLPTAPLGRNFPRRNRIISGLSRGVVIVEAADRSGALITADCGLEQGREVFAVPGPVRSVTSQGAHKLLKQGARLVTSVEDIIDELGLAKGSKPVQPRGAMSCDVGLSEPQERLLGCIDTYEPQDIDTIASEAGLELSQVTSLLLQLELKHLVHQLPGRRFVKK